MDRSDRYVDRFDDIHEGADVYSADDQKIGTVAEIHDKYLVAHKGFFFPKDLYIPTDVVDRVENDRVYVNVDKDYVDDQHWDVAPEEAQASGGAPSDQAVRDSIPDAIGTPGTTGRIEEGGREVRAGEAGSRERQIDYGRAMGRTPDQPTDTFGQSAEGTSSRSSDVQATNRARAEGEQTLHLHEEQLRATKERAQAGEVRVGKEVVEEEKTVDVPVTREEVYVERRPGDQQPDAHAFDEHTGQTIRVPVSEETVEVEKVPVETEEIAVGKRIVQDTERVTDTVRREEARIESSGGARVAGMTPAISAGRWEDVRPQYRTRWQQRFGTSGGRWEDVEPSYRYGWELAQDPRYRGMEWSDIESQARRDWGARYPDKPWDRAGRAIRDAWESATNRA